MTHRRPAALHIQCARVLGRAEEPAQFGTEPAVAAPAHQSSRTSWFAPILPSLTVWEAALLLVLPALASAAWVGLGSAHLGRFSPTLAGAAWAAETLAAAALLGLFSRYNAAWLRPSRWSVAALAIVFVLGARLALVVPPGASWPALLDGGWYAATGHLIAREGGLSFHPPALAALAEPSAFVADFAEQRAAGLGVPGDATMGRFGAALAVSSIEAEPFATQPWHPPLLATWIALWTSWFGMGAPGAAMWPWALAWLLAVGGMAERLGGARATVPAVLVAGIGPAFAWYGAAPYAELPAGALAIGGFLALAHALRAERPEAVEGVEGGNAQGGGSADDRTQTVPRTRAVNGVSGRTNARVGSTPVDRGSWIDRAAETTMSGASPLAPALLAGLLLGLAGLAKVDLLPAGIVALGWTVWRDLRGDRASAATHGLLAGLSLPWLHLVALAFGPSRAYMRINGWGVAQAVSRHVPWLAIAAVGFALVAIAWRAAQPRMATQRQRPLRSFVAPLALLFAAGVTGWSLWNPSDAAPSMITLLAWLVTPLGAWGAAAGLALMAERERGPWKHGIGVPVLLLAAVPLVAPLVTRDLSALYVARRLVPIALPVVAVLGGIAWSEGTRRGRGAGLAATAALALVLFGIAERAVPWTPGREMSGSRTLMTRIARHVGPEDILILPSPLGEDPAGRLGAALWAVEGLNVAPIGGLDESPEALASAVRTWHEQGRRVVWAGGGDVPRWPGIRAETLTREGILGDIPAPGGGLPPRWTRLELMVSLHELVPEPARSP